MSYIMGLDIGTSSAKAIVYREDGTVAGKGSSGYGISVPQTGFAEQSGQLLWESTVSAIRQATAVSAVDPKQIKAIGVTGQMHGLVMLDKSGQPLRPVIIWADQRSHHQVERIQQQSSTERIAANPAFTGFLLPSLLWVMEKETHLLPKTERIMLPKDYIRFRLTGVHGTDFSDASGTLLLDARNRRWSPEILKEYRITESILPPISESSEIAGEITAAASRETGLPLGIPVVFGGGDTPAAAVCLLRYRGRLLSGRKEVCGGWKRSGPADFV